MKKELVQFKLKGQTIAYIDWANVYGWKKSLPREVDPTRLFKYLKQYKEIADVRFYFGEDTHEKSQNFLTQMRKVGYSVVSKPVKHILVAQVDGQKIYRRKCDFDMEISMDVHSAVNGKTEGFLFVTGDGDFAPLYQLLIEKRKQVIVVYARKHIGREVWDIKKGLFKVQITHLGL